MQKIGSLIAACLAVVAVTAVAQAPVVPGPVSQSTSVSARSSANTTSPLTTAPSLSKTDLDAWLDGYMPYALATGDIAGAVIVIVKDGKVLTQRGFGYSNLKSRQPVDPDRTLFRPGSTSKLFTWTAVMQLVQAGKINLDRDINDYLDFKIPAAFGKPITMRNLMTHTAGFEETAKYLILFDPKDSRPLGEVLKRSIPKRMFSPGTVPAYSNYGATLAGYIVQRVSGEPFAEYVERHITTPLGMMHSTFQQPLAPALARDMSTGYNRASQSPEPFEIINMAPAGSLSATGSDMAKFMIAHLADGSPLLDAPTATLMHNPANTPIPGLPAMALGFYHEDRNGLNIIGHGGDTNFFHSDLHLFLDKNVGMFMSVNSGGREGAAHLLRERLFAGFTDRYFPNPAAPLPVTTTARTHGEAFAGHYVSSRGSDTTFLRFFSLIGQAQIMLNDDDTISFSLLNDAAGNPKRWREVGNWQWAEVGGDGRLNAVVKDGRVTTFSTDQFAPIFTFMPAPASLDAGWLIPALLISLAIAALTALSWPLIALVRRQYGFKPAVARRTVQLHRASRFTAWALTAVAAGWLVIVSIISSDVAALDGRLDIWMRMLQLITLGAIFGTAISIWNVVEVAKQHRRFAAIWALLFASSAAFLVWFAFNARLMTVSLDY